MVPAAFRRLCVETTPLMLTVFALRPAAFRRLCVETVISTTNASSVKSQPPSGGCVLKRNQHDQCVVSQPAAFRRLCVETPNATTSPLWDVNQPPSGGCVLKPSPLLSVVLLPLGPAAFRRLCVETAFDTPFRIKVFPAAFRRLCVETTFQYLH